MTDWGDGQSDNRHRSSDMRSGLKEKIRIRMANGRRGMGNGAFNSRTRENSRPSEGWGSKGG